MAVITYLSDTFNRANASTAGSTEVGKATWSIGNASGSGVWNITSNQLAATSNGSESYLTAESYHSDGTMQATFVNIVDGGMIFRYVDTSNFWMIWATGGVYKIMKKVSGTYTQVGGNVGTAVAGDVVSVQLDLNNINLYVNGTWLLGVTDAALDWGTKVGFRASASAATYDNFSLVSLSKNGVAANDSNIFYSPYTWVVNSTNAKTIDSGAYFKMMISGNRGQVGLFFDTTGLDTYNYIKYRIDGEGWVKALIAEQVSVPMPSASTWTKHTLEVVVQSAMGTNKWSPQGGATVFRGLAGEDTIVTQPIATAKLRGCVMGDSITEGYITLKNVSTPDGSDATMSYAGQLRYLLGAEIGQVGFGSTGWTVAGAGGVPAFPTSYKLMWGGGPARDFTTVPPDFIIINQGQNDGTTNTVTTIVNMVNDMLTLIPATTIIALVCPFSQNQKANIQSAVSTLNNKRVKFIDTSTWYNVADSADGIHPYGGTSMLELAPNLATAMRLILNGGGIFQNVGGVARGVTGIRSN